MRILLTGEPKSGKSTVLARLIASEELRWGFVTTGIFRKRQRVGFRIEASNGAKALLAQTVRPTNFQVSKYYVELSALEKFLKDLPSFNPGELIYIDEIAEMQLASADFQRLTTRCLNAKNDLIGAISLIYKHPFIDKALGREDVLVCKLTPDNREKMEKCLGAMLANRQRFNEMSEQLQQFTLNLSRQYLDHHKYNSLYKLFANALLYFGEDRIQKSGGQFIITGKTATHIVKNRSGDFTCDCPLFLGKAPFKSSAECSHIQAVKLQKFSQRANR